MIKRTIFLLLVCCLCIAVQPLYAASKRFTLVIDAGHGGHDAGAIGAISKEKDLTLKYALALGQMIERDCPEVHVIYTRKTDVYLELWQRAEIANKQKADLFISIHINALPAGRIARGYQTYTLGKGESGVGIIKNLEVAKRENSVIFMEKDYRQNYQGFDPNSAESNIMFEFIQDTNMEHSVDLAKMMQRNVCRATGRKDMGAHQANLAVLRLTSMPACLLELGFISTPDEEQFLNSANALERYTIGMYNAFVQYIAKYNTHNITPYKAKEVKTTSVPEIVPEEYKRQEKKVIPVATPEPAPVQSAQPAPQKAQKAQEAPVKEAAPSAQSTVAPGEVLYKVQVVAASKPIPAGDPRLKGYTNTDCYQDGGMYKYTIGASTSQKEISELRKQLSKDFPEAFIIKFQDGKRIK